MPTPEFAEELTQRLGPRLLRLDPFSGTLGRAKFAAGDALDVFRILRDDLGFDHLSMVGGIDWVDHREVVYALWSDARGAYLLLTTDLPADDPHIESATPIWPSANWHEREAYELVAIGFDHHPDLRHLLMPDGYVFHPLLRSFKIHEPEDLEVKSRNV